MNSKFHTNEYEDELFEYINQCRFQQNINFFHIKGHVHDGTKLSHYNNMADEIAGEMRLQELEKYNTECNKLIRKKYESFKNKF